MQFELPIRLNLSWKFTPIYRYYDQTAADYFGPYNTHLSTQEFYTSDYDLSKFSSHQWGVSLNYRAVFTQFKLLDFGLKSAQVRAQRYTRSDGIVLYRIYPSQICFGLIALFICNKMSKFVVRYFPIC